MSILNLSYILHMERLLLLLETVITWSDINKKEAIVTAQFHGVCSDASVSLSSPYKASTSKEKAKFLLKTGR